MNIQLLIDSINKKKYFWLRTHSTGEPPTVLILDKNSHIILCGYHTVAINKPEFPSNITGYLGMEIVIVESEEPVVLVGRMA